MLQIFVFLTNPKKAGAGALISIAISALSTGFTSAKIALDKDLDTQGRKNQPTFYGEVFREIGVVLILVTADKKNNSDPQTRAAYRLHPRRSRAERTLLHVDGINIGAPQLEQEHWVRLACGFIGKVDVGVFCWRRGFAFLVVEAFTRGLLILD